MQDHATRAANDRDTIGPDDFAEEQTSPGTGEAMTAVEMTPNPDGSFSGEASNPPAQDPETVVIVDEETEALRRRVQVLEAELAAFHDRRDHEQELLAERDAALHAIEAAKNQVAAEKQNLAKVEEEIAALLRSPMPIPWNETPIGKLAESAPEREAPPAPKALAEEPAPAWSDAIPPVGPSMVRLAEDEPNAPTLEAIAPLVSVASTMQGEKRKPATVLLYDRPHLVSHRWTGDGVHRFNLVPLFTKDEWGQLYEDRFGRAVDDFDQSDEAKDRRQQGGIWCGLSVKVGRSTHVVGPQEAATHLVYEVPATGDEPATEEDDDSLSDE